MKTMTLSAFACAMISAATVRPVDRLQLRAFAREQDVAQRHRRTGFAVDLLDDDLVSGGDAILLAARAHDCEHGSHHSSIKSICPRQAKPAGRRKGAARQRGAALSTASASGPREACCASGNTDARIAHASTALWQLVTRDGATVRLRSRAARGPSRVSQYGESTMRRSIVTRYSPCRVGLALATPRQRADHRDAAGATPARPQDGVPTIAREHDRRHRHARREPHASPTARCRSTSSRPTRWPTRAWARPTRSSTQLVPSFNFPQPSITDGTDVIRPATLRGLAPDQTLVLVNGKRRHVTALLNINGTVGRGSAAVDLNTHPGARDRADRGAARRRLVAIWLGRDRRA